MKYKKAPPVWLSTKALQMLDQLVDTGLFGEDQGDCIARIVEEFLWNNSDKPILKV